MLAKNARKFPEQKASEISEPVIDVLLHQVRFDELLQCDRAELQAIYPNVMTAADIILKEIGKHELPARRSFNVRFWDLARLMNLERDLREVLNYLSKGEVAARASTFFWFKELPKKIKGVEQAFDDTNPNYSFQYLLHRLSIHKQDIVIIAEEIPYKSALLLFATGKLKHKCGTLIFSLAIGLNFPPE